MTEEKESQCSVCGDFRDKDNNPIISLSNNNLMTEDSFDAHVIWNGCLRCFDERIKDNPIARVLLDVIMETQGLCYKGWKA